MREILPQVAERREDRGPTAPPNRVEVLGLLLAAGSGSRYGLPKVLAHEGLWLRSAVDALLGGGCGHVLVVLGAADTPLPPGAAAVYAQRWADGVGESLRAGLRAAADHPGARYAVIHLVDLPDVGGGVVARVLGAAAAAPNGLARAFYGGRPGHPVVAARRHWEPMAGTAAGDTGAREYLKCQGVLPARVQCEDLATGRDQDGPDRNAPPGGVPLPYSGRQVHAFDGIEDPR
ncbi:NTP transferase domain-containing protein [Rhodococcus sp. NPDC127528]|uniref:nucleotidyltransferase family protein n=1 Tax=unclassified Rhodococcus (in: high G+C Gram-positive bacteria) TaxID=192944 RepID=UPI003641F98F